MEVLSTINVQNTREIEKELVVAKSNAKHFCAGMYFIRRPDGKYELPGITDARFPNEVKMPGGTCENAPWETPEETLVREFGEETGLTPTSSRLIHSDPPKNGHTKHFFVCLKVEGQFKGPSTFREKDGAEIVVKVWGLADFHERLFNNYRTAFLKACKVLMVADRGFCRHYPEICAEVEKAQG